MDGYDDGGDHSAAVDMSPRVQHPRPVVPPPWLNAALALVPLVAGAALFRHGLDHHGTSGRPAGGNGTVLAFAALLFGLGLFFFAWNIERLINEGRPVPGRHVAAPIGQPLDIGGPHPVDRRRASAVLLASLAGVVLLAITVMLSQVELHGSRVTPWDWAFFVARCLVVLFAVGCMLRLAGRYWTGRHGAGYRAVGGMTAGETTTGDACCGGDGGGGE